MMPSHGEQELSSTSRERIAAGLRRSLCSGLWISSSRRGLWRLGPCIQRAIQKCRYRVASGERLLKNGSIATVQALANLNATFSSVSTALK